MSFVLTARPEGLLRASMRSALRASLWLFKFAPGGVRTSAIWFVAAYTIFQIY